MKTSHTMKLRPGSDPKAFQKYIYIFYNLGPGEHFKNVFLYGKHSENFGVVFSRSSFTALARFRSMWAACGVLTTMSLTPPL